MCTSALLNCRMLDFACSYAAPVTTCVLNKSVVKLGRAEIDLLPANCDRHKQQLRGSARVLQHFWTANPAALQELLATSPRSFHPTPKPFSMYNKMLNVHSLLPSS